MSLELRDEQYDAFSTFAYDALHQAASSANNNGEERDYLAKLGYTENEITVAIEGNVVDEEINYGVTHDAADEVIASTGVEELGQLLMTSFEWTEEQILAEI